MHSSTGTARAFVSLAALALFGSACGRQAGEPAEDLARSTSYDALVALFADWREFQEPRVTDGVPDYTAAAMARQRAGLETYRRRLAAIDPGAWPVSHQVDYQLVRAEMNGLEFDHRVLRPWARNPCFYTVLYTGPTDVPAREGPVMPGGIELWTYEPPLPEARLAGLRAGLRAVPAILEQAKGNLVEEARDLWLLGVRVKRAESRALADLATRVAPHHPDLVADVERARAAVDDLAAWLDARQKTMTAPSGIGVENYDWYLKHVHLVPYTWQEELTIVRRELERAWAHLKLEENRNRRLPRLEMIATAEEYQRRFRAGVRDYVDFLRREEIFTVPDYAQPALAAREGRFVPPTELREFFTQINYRDVFPMRCHDIHWIELQRLAREPHASPIRRVPLLYNIWDCRSEGLATGMEEMMMHAGLLDDRPRARELVYILLAQRGARAMGDLMMHANAWTLDQAVKFAVDWTPYGWLAEAGNTVWGEQQLYLEQPGYGTSYVIGKVLIDRLMGDRAHQLGDRFSLRQFMDDFFAAGVIPVSLIRWELTGREDEIRKLW